MAEVLDRSSLKALSADTRQDIIKLLGKRPHTASELSKKLSKHVTTVSEHLTTLEKSGLIRKKESTNKWVYYALTDKGERIFKPTYYSWIIILSISVLALVFGFQQVYTFPAGIAEEAYKAPLLEQREVAMQTEFPILGIVLIIIAFTGFAYLVIKMLKNK
jgi:DNA-binding transcriptional ArsR family regulator